MSRIDLKLRIRIVLLMAKFESPTQVQRALRSEGLKDIPSIQSINSLYGKFCEFGSVLDLQRCGRQRIPDEESTDLIMDILNENPKSTLNEISNAIGISKQTIRRRIKSDIGMYSYRIQIHQQLYDEDLDKRIEMAEILLPILKNPANKHFIFFQMKLRFISRVGSTNKTVVSGDMKNQLKFMKKNEIAQKLMFGVPCHPTALLGLIFSIMILSMV